ncbi:hypothetical protein MSG28_010375 [Choristoneura fumiferana]|uniref:Uncharacterized protein n=1 Tax=Choristoneura fumiferana TaxID=7141 RepID=A0ACC0KKB1_CHOFU|nr:hypothetical protein MSG28_010375 [Choristoneura fumiferana]
MVKILESFLVTVFLVIIEIYCSKPIGNILSEYYESDTIKSFKEEWVKYKKPFENAIMTNIKENYGAKSMNIYIKHARHTLKITRGFYLSDNIVHVLFSDMILRDWPNLIMPEVSLSLPGNLVKVEATVGKMFVDTVYRMMRNESAVLYSEAELDEAKHSPFSLQQVQSTGKLTIIAEDCFLSGFSIVTFFGNSVSLGHSSFRLVDCKFTVEISSDVGTPPVIAPYFPKGPGKQIESLLSQPIHDEMVQNLQGAIYSYINTSVVFGKELPKYKFNQQKLFKKTSNYMSSLCDKLNSLTLKSQKGTIALNDFEDHMEKKTDEKQSTTYISLKELKLYGLDSAYASRDGGSFEASQLSIADCIRFHSLQVRGIASYDNGTQYTHNFAVELADLTVNIVVNIEKRGSNSVHKFDVVFGRTFDFSILPWETGSHERLWYQALVSGYIISEVPARITEHLSGVLTPAANDDEEDLKLNEKNSQSEEKIKKVKIPNDDDVNTDVAKEEFPVKSIEEPNARSENENENQPSGNPADTTLDSNTSAESKEKLSNKTQESDIGVMVTAPEALLVSDYITDKQGLAGGKADAILDSDFFSDEKGKKTLFSGIEAEETNKENLAGDKTDDVLDKDFFSDNERKKPLFSGIEAEETNKENLAGDKTDDVLDKDFFSDNEGKKPLFSGIEAEETNKENLAGDKTDDVLDKNLFSDGEGKIAFFSDDDKKFISDGDGQKHFVKSENDEEKDSVKSEDNVNNNSETTNNKEDKHIYIFASSENGRDKDDDISEQADQQSVPIERTGKNNHGTAQNETVNRKRPTKKIHKLNKKEKNNLKMTLRRNPRANTTTVHRRMITTQSVKHLQASRHHNKTRSLQNEVHMSDNEIR